MVSKLTPKQLRAIEALMATSTIDAAATAAGVHRSTLFRWLQDATFCAELRRASDAAIAATARRLATLGTRATEVLSRMMDVNQDDVIQLRAAATVLTHMMRIVELHDIEQRLSQLEKNSEHVETIADA